MPKSVLGVGSLEAPLSAEVRLSRNDREAATHVALDSWTLVLLASISERYVVNGRLAGSKISASIPAPQKALLSLQVFRFLVAWPRPIKYDLQSTHRARAARQAQQPDHLSKLSRIRPPAPQDRRPANELRKSCGHIALSATETSERNR
jgi:hypothetical protein